MDINNWSLFKTIDKDFDFDFDLKDSNKFDKSSSSLKLKLKFKYSELMIFGPFSVEIHSIQKNPLDVWDIESKKKSYFSAQLLTPPKIYSSFPGLYLKIPYLNSLSFLDTGEVILKIWSLSLLFSISKINFLFLFESDIGQ